MNSDPIAEPAVTETAAPSFKDNLSMRSSGERCDKIFYVALKLKDSAKRKRFLERACARDAQLRSAVEELLDIYAKADRFFGELSSALGLDGNSLYREFCFTDAQIRPSHPHVLPCVDR
jgi:hypothetical protein